MHEPRTRALSALNLALWGIGIVLIAAGYVRAREPWRRYLALRVQQENADRYEAWRGRSRGRAADSGPSGADVAMAMFRRQAQVGAAIVVVGFVLVFAGFAVR